MVRDGHIKLGDKIDICVPTGNFGNILGAYYAKVTLVCFVIQSVYSERVDFIYVAVK
mgnify:FL=1